MTFVVDLTVTVNSQPIIQSIILSSWAGKGTIHFLISKCSAYFTDHWFITGDGDPPLKRVNAQYGGSTWQYLLQMAAYAYSTQASSREQQFSNWAWSIALRLKLHRQAAILHSRAAESHPFQAPSLEQEQWLLPLATAARAKNPLACFLVLSMTDVGHE